MGPVMFAALVCGGAAALLLVGNWIASKLGW